MARQSLVSPKMLRRRPSLRGVLSWLLLTALVAGAASVCQGSRYALAAGPGSCLAAVSEPDMKAPSTPNAGGSADSSWPSVEVSAGGPGAAQDIPAATQFREPAVPQQECCQRRPAPRSEPALLRIALPDPPAALTPPSAAASLLVSDAPPQTEPATPAPQQLSISRT